MPWANGLIFLNPVDGQVLADTGPLVLAGSFPYTYRLIVIAVANVGAEVLIQHRDAPNAISLESWLVPASTAPQPWVYMIELRNGERVRAVQRGAVNPPAAGEVQVSIWYGS